MKPPAMLQLAASLAMATLPATSVAIDLVTSYQRALGVDATKLAADQAVIAGREKAVQGDALLRPQISLSASYTHINDTSSTNLPPPVSDIVKPESSGGVHSVGLHLRQPLYDAKAAAEKKQLHEQTELAEVTYEHAQQDVMARVSEAYFNVLIAQESVRVVAAEKTAVAIQRERAQARFDVGRGKVTELQETQARLDTVIAKEISAQSALEQRRTEYEELTGADARGLAELRSDFSRSRLLRTTCRRGNARAWSTTCACKRASASSQSQRPRSTSTG
jgi:outer membrane protein